MTLRHALATAALAVLLVTAATTSAAAQDDVSDQCRTIVGCAEAGPEPENPGDRGGYAQLLTLAVLVGGVAFVMTNVVRAARAGPGVHPGPAQSGPVESAGDT